MSTEQSHIDTRSPKEMYDAYYARTISIAEAVKKSRPPPEFGNANEQIYFFDFDKNALYTYIYTSEDRFFHYFERESDGAQLIMTRYSEAPELKKIIIWK